MPTFLCAYGISPNSARNPIERQDSETNISQNAGGCGRCSNRRCCVTCDPAHADSAPTAPTPSVLVRTSCSTPLILRPMAMPTATRLQRCRRSNRLISFDWTAGKRTQWLPQRQYAGRSGTAESVIVLRRWLTGTATERWRSRYRRISQRRCSWRQRGTISFARSPNLPTAVQDNLAVANPGTHLHSVQIGTDSQVIVTAATTNAASALSGAELVKIYRERGPPGDRSGLQRTGTNRHDHSDSRTARGADDLPQWAESR